MQAALHATEDLLRNVIPVALGICSMEFSVFFVMQLVLFVQEQLIINAPHVLITPIVLSRF